jgi:hypothetical protein
MMRFVSCGKVRDGWKVCFCIWNGETLARIHSTVNTDAIIGNDMSSLP